MAEKAWLSPTAKRRLFLGAEFSAAAIALGLGLGSDNFYTPHTQTFIEGDASLSHPLFRPATVPSTMLAGISVGIPLCLIVIVVGGRLWQRGADWRVAGATVLFMLLALLEAFAWTNFTTNMIKNYVGRPRPNFFAYINYRGLATAGLAVNANNQAADPAANAAYLASITPGAFGDFSLAGPITGNSVLTGDALREARRSFPSGHASLSFCGMGVTVFVLRWLLQVRDWTSWRALLAGAPYTLAVWISCTRVRDYYHSYDDVAVGAAIGLIFAALAWQTFQRHASVRDPVTHADALAKAKAAVAQDASPRGTPSDAGTSVAAAAGRTQPDAGSNNPVTVLIKTA